MVMVTVSQCTCISKHQLAQPCVLLSHVKLFETPWTVASQAPLPMTKLLEQIAISYSGDLTDPVIKPTYLMSPALAGSFFTIVPPGKPCTTLCKYNYLSILLH